METGKKETRKQKDRITNPCLVGCLVLSCLFLSIQVKSQEAQSSPSPSPTQTPPQQQSQKQKLKGNLFIWRRDEVLEKYRKEQSQLREKQKKERQEALERYRKEKQETRKKNIKERQEAQEKLKTERIKEKDISTNIQIQMEKNKESAKKLIDERRNEIRMVKKRKRYIEIVTSENDPLYIAEADIVNAKTQFLGVKDVEFTYKVKLQNQTPKIINIALIVWERQIPFTNKLTVVKQTKISKPIIPYEKRIVKYNDLDSKRDGETYKVKVAHIIFEDGTQWKNPSI